MTEDGKFEIGDLVRCIKEPDDIEHSLAIGTEFTIIHVNYDGYIPILCRSINGQNECFRVELFKLVRSFGTHKILKRKGDLHADKKDL